MKNNSTELSELEFYKNAQQLYLQVEQSIHALKMIKLELEKKSQPQDLFNSFLTRLSKIQHFVMTILAILNFYYIFIFWYLIPYFESTETGLSLSIHDFLAVKEDKSDTQFRICFFIFYAFHIVIFMLIWSITKLVTSNPGYLDNEYLNINSLINFQRIIVKFLTYNKEYYENEIKSDKIEVVVEPAEKLKFSFNNFEDTQFLDLNEEQTMIESIKAIILFEKDFISKKKEIVNYTNHLKTVAAINTKNNEIINYNINNHRSPLYRPVNDENLVTIFESFYEKNFKSKQKYSRFDNIKFITPIKDNFKSICSYCLVNKPDRTHHCKQCRKCVRKMDHHCSFLASCIAFGNYKYFILTIFYGMITLIFINIMILKALYFYYNQYPKNYFSYLAFQYTLLSIFTGLFIYFAFIHANFVIYNSTTIEHVEKNIKENEPIEYNNKRNYYDISLYKNVKNVMGNPWTWLIPTDPTDYHLKEGYDFEINNSKYLETKNEIIKEWISTGKYDLNNRYLNNYKFDSNANYNNKETVIYIENPTLIKDKFLNAEQPTSQNLKLSDIKDAYGSVQSEKSKNSNVYITESNVLNTDNSNSILQRESDLTKEEDNLKY